MEPPDEVKNAKGLYGELLRVQWRGLQPLDPETRKKHQRGVRRRRWVRAILFGLVALLFAAVALQDIRYGGSVDLLAYLVLAGAFAVLALHQGLKAASMVVPRNR